MKHFGFLINLSQALNTLPNVDGSFYWTPVNNIAHTISDLVLSDHKPQRFYPMNNPIRQQGREMNVILAGIYESEI